jgi:hypothetical protein
MFTNMIDLDQVRLAYELPAAPEVNLRTRLAMSDPEESR